MPKQFIYITILAGIFCCCMLTASAEPFLPIPTKDSATKLLRLLKISRADTNRVNILLPLTQFYLYKENASTDSAEMYIDLALSLSESLHYTKGFIKGLYLQAYLFLYRGEGPADATVEKGITISRQKGYTELEALGYSNRGFFMSSSPPESVRKMEYIKKGMALYHQLGDRVHEAYLLKTIADVHLEQGDFAGSLKELLSALSIYKSAGWADLHFTYDLISVVNAKMGNYEEALRYGLAALKSAENARDTGSLIFFYYRFVVLNFDLNDYEEALRSAKIGMRLSELFDGNPYMSTYASLIASILSRSGKPAEGLKYFTNYISKNPPADSDEVCRNYEFLAVLNLRIKRYDVAENYYLKILAQRAMIPDNHKNYYDMHYNQGIGSLYIITNQFSKAKIFLEKALSMQSMSSSLEKASIHKLLFRVDSAEGDYRGAIGHLQLCNAITDSLFNDTKSKQIASLKIQYETDKKEQNIKLLTSENKEQLVILKQRAFQRNVMIVGVSMLLLLFWLGITRYRSKQQANVQLQAQQEIINHKNLTLEKVVSEKDNLLINKDELIKEKQDLINEKEWLLKEIHHRVKNNLQIVISLLNTQSAYLDNEPARIAIRDSQNRMHSMSLIHKKLYQSENLASIEMSWYVDQLINSMRESFATGNKIAFLLQLDNMELDVIQAVPIGLILNEAVSNAIKYAFPEDRQGRIEIELVQKTGNLCQLKVSDNGVGVPAGFNFQKNESLGMELMRGLTEQLDGHFRVVSNNGLTVRIDFTAKHTFKSDRKNAVN